MSQSATERKSSRPLVALLLAVLIAWAFLATSLWLQLPSGEMFMLGSAQVATEALRTAPVQHQIAAFIGAQLLIHAVMGAIVWVLAAASARSNSRLRWPIAVWSVLLFGAVYVFNAAQFPASQFAALHPFVASTLIGTVTIADALAIWIVVLAVAVLARAALSFDAIRQRPRHIAAAILVVTAGVLWSSLLARGPVAVVDAHRPHVVIIGIDSLRTDAVGDSGQLGFTPNISSFRHTATSFPDAVTPLGRTFPSWVTILSGRHPVRSGARDLLMPASVLNAAPTLAHRLGAAGYETVFATDEVRYSNIDESFGFDQVVSPTIGAADFLVGLIADLPLSNLVANTRVGAWLLPNVYGNRALAALYRPGTFVDWLDRSVDFQRPTFLAVHLTLPHWPYFSADTVPAESVAEAALPNRYLKAVAQADRQFGQLMHILDERGVLANAVVIVLSDHGEAVGLAQDGSSHGTPMIGHGISTLSPSQYQVVLAVRRYARGVAGKGRVSTAPVTLEDIAPTVLAMVDVAADPADFDGVSLTGEVLQPGSLPELRARVRFTETGLTTNSLRKGNFDEADNLREAVEFYDIEPASGRIVFDAQLLADLLAQKEHAALSEQGLLAVIPEPATSRRAYVFVERSGDAPGLVTFDPDAVSDPRFVFLWQALQRRFGSEVRPTEE